MKRPDAATATRTGADDGQPSNRRTVSAKTVKFCHTPDIRTYQLGSRIASPSPAHPEILHTPPPPLYQIDIGEVREVLDQVMEPWPNNTGFDSLPPLDWNEASVDILSTLDQALSSEPVKAAFYTDGSFYEPGVEYGLSPGSWAVLLVLETPSATQHFGGFICGTVSLAQHSTDVENLALIAAAMWAIQLLGQFNPNLQVEFCYDSLNAGRNSQGSCAESW